MLEKRSLGRTGLTVTALGYGAMELRDPKNHENAGRILGAVLDAGITFIDTSQDYRMSETLIGQHIAHRRAQYKLATKCGCNLSGHGPAHVFTRAQFAANLEDSLRKLRTDYIDLWQMHCVTPPDLPGGAMDDAVRAMQDAKAQGKVGAIGISFKNGSEKDPFYPTQHQVAYACEMAGWGVFDTIQMVYGALTRTSEKEIERIADAGVGVIARGVLKRYFPDYEQRARDARLSEFFDPGEDLNDFLLRFALSQKGISTMIIGSGNPAHIVKNVRAAEKGPLPADVFAQAKLRLGE